MKAIHNPSKSCFEAALSHLLHTGEKLRPPIGEIARARTPGGIYRQLFAVYRKEIRLGIVSENCLTVSP